MNIANPLRQEVEESSSTHNMEQKLQRMMNSQSSVGVRQLSPTSPLMDVIYRNAGAGWRSLLSLDKIKLTTRLRLLNLTIWRLCRLTFPFLFFIFFYFTKLTWHFELNSEIPVIRPPVLSPRRESDSQSEPFYLGGLPRREEFWMQTLDSRNKRNKRKHTVSLSCTSVFF